jgi:hypothetical protein
VNGGLEEAIGDLLRVLRARGNPVAGNLLPGIDPGVQRRRAEAEGLDLDPELVTWYSLIGGLTTRGEQYEAEASLAPAFLPNSLERSLERRRWLISFAGNPDHTDSYLPGIEAFLPISTAGMLFFCAVNRGRPETPVHRFDMVDSNTRYNVATYPSVQAMVEDWVQRWEDGAYEVDPRMGAVERSPA